MKKMYGRIAAVITAAALVFSMAGCGQKKAAEDDKLKVALLITSNLGDKGFYDSANDGMKLIASELGAEVKTIEMGQDPSKYEPYFRDVAEQDWDYIIVGSSPAVEVAETLIPQYPDKKFIMFDTEVDWSKGDFKNLYCVQYKQNEGSFLAGAVAAIMTTEGKMPIRRRLSAVLAAVIFLSSTTLCWDISEAPSMWNRISRWRFPMREPS